MHMLQMSELDSTSFGRHNTTVLKKRFLDVQVLNPAQRKAQPYPASARMLWVTTLCQNHSPWNATRKPWNTDELLSPVFARIEIAQALEVVGMENVPEFLHRLDGQQCSFLDAALPDVVRIKVNTPNVG